MSQEVPKLGFAKADGAKNLQIQLSFVKVVSKKNVAPVIGLFKK